MLENRDYTIIIDKSGSMATADMNGKSRWEAAKESTFAIAAKCEKLDPDGLTLYLFSSNFKKYDNVTSGKVNDVWAENEPNGGTALDAVLKDALAGFAARKKAGQLKENGEIIVVVTDGEPNDQSAVAKVIIEGSKALDKDEELAILFCQIGNDSGATKFLEYLDDGLAAKGAKFDIVDTIKFSDMENTTITEMLEKALVD